MKAYIVTIEKTIKQLVELTVTADSIDEVIVKIDDDDVTEEELIATIEETYNIMDIEEL